ncbi:NADPH-dependent oxidoreductase [Clostridium estertheticum]|uniref:NADPH-dependent oxidoreductase n=1 Tax=Clostridium estertheticum TaxID=238834 RepID=UPI0013E90244|nr:NADPH-dependent oxidoreductase [Clostridium estertheticum]MBZ9689191.1 NADPH-dependent oxidoreductase [Clostridium estertheticum]
MNEVIKLLNNHRSIRNYTDELISEEDLDLIIRASQSAPSSINGQQVTIIGVKDEVKKKKLSELVGDQVYVDKAPLFLVFCADFYRAKLAAEITGEKLVITESEEARLVGAVDVGLALSNAIAAAESLGLGIVPIGGIRKEPEAVAELLGLPQFVFPMVGLAIGHPAEESEVKPRFPKEVVYHSEVYNKDVLGKIKEYDEVIKEHMIKATEGKLDKNWSETVAGVYKYVYYPKVKAAIEKQGFTGEK